MSYASSVDFLALLRQTSGGMRAERMPGLDYLVAAMARAGVFSLAISATAPTVNQSTTAWFRPSVPSWSAEGALFLWNAALDEYEPATPTLWAALLGTTNLVVVQMVTTPGPVNVRADAHVVLVNQLVAAPITLVMPLSTVKNDDVLISDWKGDAGTNNIKVTLTGTDIFPGNNTDWTIASDTGSIFLRPLSGLGYAL